MTTKKDNIATFNSGKSNVITYAGLMGAFNNLNNVLHGEWYGFHNKMTNTTGGTTCGFSYKGYAAGMGLRNILDKINIRYVTYTKHGSGIDEESEIHIDPRDQKKMLNIIENLGYEPTSNVTVEIDIRISKINENLFKEIGR